MEQIISSSTQAKKTRFFTAWDWRAFWTAFLVSFAVYFCTLAPTVTMEDCGELATAGAYLGVPHPPGYPIWTMLAWLFTKVFSFVTFRGQPNPAWAIALMSAFFGALASGLSALLICRSGSDIIQQIKGSTETITNSTREIFCWIGGTVASLLFAFSPVNWSQSVIVEVYSLNAFFLVLILVIAYMWLKRPADNTLILLSFLFGIGMTNYQGLLLLLPALAILVLLRNMSLFRDFMVVSFLFLCVFVLMKASTWAEIPKPQSPKDQHFALYLLYYLSHAIQSVSLPGFLHPVHFTCTLYVTLNFLVLILAYYFLPNGRTVALSILGLELGLAVYGFMPLASETNPPMNWGYARTFDGFMHAVTRGQYEQIVPADPFSMQFIRQIVDYLKDLRGQYTLLVAPLGLLPFVTWEFMLGNRRVRAIYAAIPLYLAAAILIFIEELIHSSGIPAISLIYISLLCVLLVIQFIGMLTLFSRQVMDFIAQLFSNTARPSERVTIILLFILMTGLIVFCEVKLYFRLAEIMLPLKNTQDLLPGQVPAIILKGAGLLLLMLLPALYIPVCRFIKGSTSLRLTIDNDSQKWIVAMFFSFLVMSLLFVWLANPKGDIQDYFVQRVKFISSHALYSFWIGYGIIFGLVVMTQFFRGSRLVKWSGVAIAALLPLVPIEENAFNKEQIRVVGGAEQNGHDFGWQFGNYQLRGAEAINEELDPSEEPLPNPSYPPEMTANAIFFGGTDPGRFVPTYMIYSAKVREDVYLITQNALADGTYMNVMRDLYGGRIWIPSLPDNSSAFQRYVDDVQSGRRPPSADIDIEPSGRVRISGSTGVMEINGVLAQMIFEHNNYKHDFYVEESYPLRWMYPYLEPHGLIMKINRKVLPRISDERTHDDSDFWDWNIRRLSSSSKFRRDIVARKSFAKLRCAIAGMYIFSNEPRAAEAEKAFNESRILYPIWPESVFREAELYMAQGRFSDARRLVSSFQKQDPRNSSSTAFLDRLDSIEKLNLKIRDLEGLARANRLSPENAFELSDCYYQLRQIDRAAAVINNILSITNLPAPHCLTAAKIFSRLGRVAEMNKAITMCTNNLPANTPAEVFVEIAGLFAQSHQFDKMTDVLKRYLESCPDDWKAWLDLATLQVAAKQNEDALKSIENAVRKGGSEAIKLVNANPGFRNLVIGRKP